MKINKLTDKNWHVFFQQINFLKEPVVSNNFSLLLIENAEGVHVIDKKIYSVTTYHLHIIFPGQKHYFKLKEKGQIYQIIISDNCLKMFKFYFLISLSYYRENPTVNLSREKFYLLLHEFRDIENEIGLNKSFWGIIYSRIRIIALVIGREVCKILMKEKKSQLPVFLLIQFIILLIKHSRTQRTVKYYADELSISSNYLNILCKRFFNEKAIAIINNDASLEIRNSLIVTKKPIKEIAYEFNFTSLTSFSSFFRKNVGVSPREFIKNRQINQL